MLLRVDKPIPADHFVANRVVLLPLDLSKVTAVHGIIEDVTSFNSPGPWREKRCVGLSVSLFDMPEFMSPEVYLARVAGGGEYFMCEPNGECTRPLTEADQERIEDAIDAWNYDD